MAFKIRCEFWSLANDGVGATILDEAISDAVEYTSAQSAIALPDTEGAYAMSVYGVSGSATVEVNGTPVGTAARGKLVTTGSTHWFHVTADKKITVIEYT